MCDCEYHILVADDNEFNLMLAIELLNLVKIKQESLFKALAYK